MFVPKGLIEDFFYQTLKCYEVSTVPVDSLAPNGARPSADTMMANSGSHTYTYISGTLKRVMEQGPTE